MKKFKELVLNTAVTINTLVIGWWVVSYVDVVLNHPSSSTWNCFYIFF